MSVLGSSDDGLITITEGSSSFYFSTAEEDANRLTYEITVSVDFGTNGDGNPTTPV